MSDRFALPPGSQLQEYVIEDVLGFGGFGITYRATDLALNSTVAIKEYFPSSLAVRDNTSAVRSKSVGEEKDYRWGLRRFISEARTLAKFKHDNIVRVFRSFSENNTAYMVLEYVEGQNMESWLKDLGRSPTQEELDGITKPITEALSLVHEENIFHRDVKPKNIYIRKEDSTPVLLDFGSARYAFSEHSASTAAIVSRFYSPYECYAADTKMQGPWTDIYGMAATLYRAIRGAPPSEATNRVIQDDYEPLRTLDSLKGKYRPAFLEAIDAGLAVFPRDRPQSALNWLAQLEGRTTLLPMLSGANLTKSSPRRVSAKPMLGAAGLLAAALLSVVFAYPYFSQKPVDAPQESNLVKASTPPSQNPLEAAIATPDRIPAKTQNPPSADVALNSTPLPQNGPSQREETQVASGPKVQIEVRDESNAAPEKANGNFPQPPGKTAAPLDPLQQGSGNPPSGNASLKTQPSTDTSDCEGLRIAVGFSSNQPCIKPGSGQSFWDCKDCPEMLAIPPGTFVMGSPAAEPERDSDETQQNITIAKPFAASKYAVTFEEWDACVADSGCDGYSPSDRTWGRGNRPVINVSWDDAQAYVRWLSNKVGRTYRLLSEAEFEYVARAGTDTPFWWGNSITPDLANYDGSAEPYQGGGGQGEYRKTTLPVNAFQPNPWGLYQVHGNVWSWVADCYNASEPLAPTDGKPRTSGDCSFRFQRGGSWRNAGGRLRAATRSWDNARQRFGFTGFRVARDL